MAAWLFQKYTYAANRPLYYELNANHIAHHLPKDITLETYIYVEESANYHTLYFGDTAEVYNTRVMSRLSCIESINLFDSEDKATLNYLW